MTFKETKTAILQYLNKDALNSIIYLELYSWQQFPGGNGAIVNNGQYEFVNFITEENFTAFLNQFLENPITTTGNDWLFAPSVAQNHPDIDYLLTVNPFSAASTDIAISSISVSSAILINSSNDKYLDVLHPDENKDLYQVFNPVVRFDGRDEVRLIDHYTQKTTFIKCGQYDVLIDDILYEKATPALTLREKINDVAKTASLFFLNNQFVDLINVQSYYDDYKDFNNFELVKSADEVSFILDVELENGQYRILGLTGDFEIINEMGFIYANGEFPSLIENYVSEGVTILDFFQDTTAGAIQGNFTIQKFNPIFSIYKKVM